MSVSNTLQICGFLEERGIVLLEDFFFWNQCNRKARHSVYTIQKEVFPLKKKIILHVSNFCFGAPNVRLDLHIESEVKGK